MNAFLVCFKNEYNDILYLFSVQLPESWHGDIPFVLPLNLLGAVVDDASNDKSREKQFNWGIIGSDVNPLVYFDSNHVEPGSCYSIELDTAKRRILIKSYLGNKIDARTSK